MIDTPAPVVAKRVTKIVPVRVLHAFRMELAKNIGEAPGATFFVSVACVNVEINITDAAVGVINVDRLRRGVQVSDPQRGLAGIQVILDVTAEASEPFDLEGVLFRAN